MAKKVIYTKGSEDTFRTKLFREIEKLIPKKFIILNSILLRYLDKNEVLKKREFDGIILLKEHVEYEGDLIKIPLNRQVEAVIETKSPESKESGIKQAVEGSDFLNTEYYFATNFKNLYLKDKDNFESLSFEKSPNENILDIAKIISEKIIKRKPVKITEKEFLKDSTVVKILKQCMEYIERDLALIDPKILEKTTGLLWARKIDSKTYSSKSKSEELEHDARKAAAYLLIDQLIFYSFLSSDIDKYPKITEINDIDEIQRCFKTVLVDNYTSIFGVDLLGFLPKTKETVETINEIIDVINHIPFKKFELDILGKIFHGLIPLKIRKHLAAYYTNNEAALLLAKLAINDWQEEVLDLACGSGTLLTAAYFVKKRMLPIKYTTDVHRQIIDQIYGNDVSIFAAHLATINLAFQNVLAFTNKVNIAVGDAFALNPKSLVYAVPSISPKKIDLDGKTTEMIKFSKYDVIFMNPPFTRHERMEAKQKKIITTTLESQNLKSYIDKKMGYNAYFILHSHIFLKKGGRLALVLPSSTFYSDYGQKLKKFFIDKKYSIKFLGELQGKQKTSFSEDCDYKEFLLVAERGTRQKEQKATLFSLFELPTQEDCIKIADEIKGMTSNLKNDKYEIRIVSQKELLTERNWLNLFKGRKESSFNIIIDNTTQLVKMKDAESVNITSGFHGTYIEVLSIPNKYWAIEKDLKDHGVKIYLKEDSSVNLTIPKKFLIPSFRKPELYQKVYEQPSHFVINISETDRIPIPFAKKYLKFIEGKLKSQIEKQIKNGKMRNKLSPLWYCETNRSGSYKNISKLWIVWKLRLEKRKSFAFLSPLETTAHHAFYRLELENEDFNELLVSWMNTTFWAYQLFINSRTVAKGLIQLMINDMNEIYIPKLDLIDEQSINEIILHTQALKNMDLSEFPDQLDEDYRKDLDKAWLKALNIPEEQIDGIIEVLYNYMKEIIIKR